MTVYGLPYTMLTDQRRGIHSGTPDEETAGKVVWMQETEPIGLWAYAEPPCLSAVEAR